MDSTSADGVSSANHDDGTSSSAEQGAATRRSRRQFIGGILATGGVAGVATALGFRSSQHGPSAPKGEATVVRGGTLIDSTGAAPLQNAALLIQDGKITRVARATDLPIPHGARLVDATGKWIIPGLVDFHVHLLGYVDARILLAYGVTTVRDAGNDVNALDRLIRDAAAGQFPMPSIFGCGRVLTGTPPVTNPGLSWEMRNATDVTIAVDAIANHGYAWVKTYVNLPLALTSEIIAAAHQRQLPVTMHASWAGGAADPTAVLTTQRRAIELGIDGLEHTFQAIADLPSLYPVPTDRAPTWLQVSKAWSGVDLEAPAAQQFIQAAVGRKVTWTPTLAVHERSIQHDQSDVTSTQAYSLMPTSWTAPWPKRVLSTGWGPADFATGQAGFERMLAFVGLLRAAGVNLLAGSDINNPFTVPGVSLHRELELLVQAGLSPMEAIRAATAKPAEALGRGTLFGTLQTGKQADLVILGADPLTDISNVGRVEQVMRLGQLYDPAALLAAAPSTDDRLVATSPWTEGRACC